MIKRTALLTLSVLGLSASLQSSTLMLDFGPTVAIDDAGTDNSLINSPYHTANTSFTDTSWNQVQTADIASGGLLWSDGTTATGIALNIGATTVDQSTTVGLANTPSINSALGGFTNTGVYAATSVGKDGISTSTGSSGTRAVGFQLSGLAAGTYDIYITARNTSLSGAYVQNLYIGKSATTGSFSFSAYNTAQLSYDNASDSTTSWSVGDNYVKLSISITSGEYLNLASYGGTGEGRGFLNSVQIVSAIPEPSSYALAAGAGCVLLATVRRRPRSL